MHTLEQRVVGSPAAIGIFSTLYTAYNNSPATALLYFPFTFWDFLPAFHLYQLWMIGLFIAAAGVTAQTLPRQERRRAWLFGIVVLLILDPFQQTITNGQVDGWIVLTLAISLWAVQRANWALAGAAVSFAAFLKISPGLLLVYLLWQRKWSAAVGAGVVTAGVLGLTSALGRPLDWGVWIGGLLPQLANGTLYIYNQALPATLARVLGAESNFMDPAIPLGAFRLLAPLVAVGCLILAKRARRPTTDPAVLAVLILGALVMGPLSWIIYATWALPALVQLMNSQLWTGWTARVRFRLKIGLLLGGLLQVAPPPFWITPARVAGHWELRLLTILPGLGILLWFTVGVLLIRHPALVVKRLPSAD